MAEQIGTIEEGKNIGTILSGLNVIDVTAIQMKYLGKKYSEIAELIGVSTSTVDSWFFSTGRLYQAYQEYSAAMNAAQAEDTLEKLCETEENVARITTYVMREFAKRMKAMKVMLVNDDGSPKLDSNGNPQYVDVPAVRLNMKDFKQAFEIQRLIQGKATNISDSNVNIVDKDKLERDSQAIKDFFSSNEERSSTPETVSEQR